MSSHAERVENEPLAWSEICELAARGRFDGFHVDTDEWGRILMTPVDLNHGRLSARVVRLLHEHLCGGEAVVEVGVATRRGVKAPDVMWLSSERMARRTGRYEDPRAGEVCVEVLSASNHPTEIEEKRRLYFEQGAEEVWICERDGRVRFWVGPDAVRERSALAPGFPDRVELARR